MHIQVLTKETLSAADIKFIFEEVVPPQIKEQIIKHAQWLDGEPELEHINEFNNITEAFPSWPYELKAYAYKFNEPANEIISDLGITDKEKRTAWFNLIKAISILGPSYINERDV